MRRHSVVLLQCRKAQMSATVPDASTTGRVICSSVCI